MSQVINIGNNYQALFENPLIAIVTVDYHAKIIDADEYFCKLMEYTRDELVGRSIFEFTLGNSEERHFARLEGRVIPPISGDGCEDGYRRYKSKSGKIIVALTYDVVTSVKKCEAITVQKTFIDITELVRAENDLKKLHKLPTMILEKIDFNNIDEILNSLTESIAEILGVHRVSIITLEKKQNLFVKAGYPDGAHGIGVNVQGNIKDIIMRTIKKGSITYICDVFKEQKLNDVHGFLWHHCINSILYVPFASKQKVSGVIVIDGVNGQKFTPNDIRNTETIANICGSVITLFYKAKKITEQMIRQERLRITTEEIDGLAHSMLNNTQVGSSYINRANTKVKDMLEIINKLEISSADKEKIAKLQNSITSSLAESKNSINSISSTVSSIQQFTSNKPLNKSRVVLGDYFERILSMYPCSKECKLKINIQNRLDRIHLELDEEVIRHAIFNLIQNVEEALKESDIVNKRIKINIRTKQTNLVIIVTNTGQTIQPAMRTKLFNIFYARKTSGTNISLASTKVAVEKHDGTAELNTNHKRTQFIIEIPLS